MEQKYNPLLVFTTFNQLDMTRKCLEYAQELGFDILVIDDNSTDGTQEYLSQIKVETLLKSERKGLTDSWNWAYKYWKMSKEYSHLVLCNNDVLIPKGAIEGLMSDYALTVPMCNESGAGYACKDQSVLKHHTVFPLGITESSYDVDSVQKHVTNTMDIVEDLIINKVKPIHLQPIKCWTGFCMCLSRIIIDVEREDGNLWNPANINVGNDDDLAKRVRAYIALGSFCWHAKGISFNGRIADRNNLDRTY